MKKKDTAPKTKKIDSERETRVLLEKIGSDVKTVTEQYGNIIERIDELKNDLARKINII